MSKIRSIASRVWYGLMHRFHPKHKYNVIKIKSLTPGYYDPDVRMLHGCFDLFEEWFSYNVMEAELMDRDTMNESHPGTFEDLFELYTWWTEQREQEHAEAETFDEHEALEEKDDAMMLRLMKIRRTIWYL